MPPALATLSLAYALQVSRKIYVCNVTNCLKRYVQYVIVHKCSSTNIRLKKSLNKHAMWVRHKGS